MSSYQPITHEGFADLRWQPPTHYLDAKHYGPITLSPREVYPAAAVMPVAFAKQGKVMELVAIVGQHPNENLFIGPNGQWLGSYIPAVLRQQPFCLVPTGNGEATLCVDKESEWISKIEGHPFFESDQPSETIKRVLADLKQWHNDREEHMKVILTALQSHSLLTPWELPFTRPDGSKVAYEGLYRIDTEALEGLKGDALEQLHHVHALPMIYAHRLSTFHLHLLDRLAAGHAKSEHIQPDNLCDVFEEDDGDLSFDFDR